MRLSKLAVLIIFAVLTAAVFCSPVIASTTITVGSVINAELNQKVTVPVTITTDEKIGLFSFVVDNHTSNANVVLNDTYTPQSQHVDYRFGDDRNTSSLKVTGTARGTQFTGENQAVFSIDVTPTSESVIPIKITEVKLGDNDNQDITDFTLVNGTVSTVPAPAGSTYNITVLPCNNGSITPVGDIPVINGNVTVPVGNNQGFTITANSGYEIDDVLVDGVSVGNVSTYPFENVLEDHRISAIFDKEHVVYDYHVNLTNGTAFIPYTNISKDGYWSGRGTMAIAGLDIAAHTNGLEYNISHASYLGGDISLDAINGHKMEQLSDCGTEDWKDDIWIYWKQYVNGVPNVVGIGAKEVKAGDKITLAYTTWAGGIADAEYIVNITVDNVIEPNYIYKGEVTVINNTLWLAGANSYFYPYTTDAGVLAAGATEGHYTYEWTAASVGSETPYLWSVNKIKDKVSDETKSWHSFINGEYTYGNITDVNDGDIVSFLYIDHPTVGYNSALVSAGENAVILKVNVEEGPIEIADVEVSVNADESVDVSNSDSVWSASQTFGAGTLALASEKAGFTYNVSESGWLTDINGIASYSSSTGYGWTYTLNGNSTGPLTNFTVSDGDVLKFSNMPNNGAGTPVFDYEVGYMGSIIGYDWHKLTIHVKDITPIHLSTAIPDKITASVPAVFTANITTNNSGIVNSDTVYSWKFGDSTSASGSVVEKTYSSAGTYHVTVTASNSGLTDTKEFDVTVNAAPKEQTNPVESNITSPVSIPDEQKPIINFDQSDLNTTTGLNVKIDKYETNTTYAANNITDSGKELPPNSAAVLLYLNVSTVEGVDNSHSLGSYANVTLNITLGSYTAENISFFRYADGASTGEKLNSRIFEQGTGWAKYSVMVPGFSAIVASVNEVTPAVPTVDPVTPTVPTAYPVTPAGGYDDDDDDDDYSSSSGTTPVKTQTPVDTQTPVKTQTPVNTQTPVKSTAQPTPTSSPAPFIGIMAALGAAVILRRR